MNGENQTFAPSNGPQVQPVPVQQPVQEPMMMQPEAVPAAAPKAGKKLLGPIIAVVVVAVVIAGLFIAKAILSSPKAVFSAAIDNVYKEMSNVLDTVDEKFNIGEKAVEFGFTTKIESNMDALKESKLDKIEFNARMGVDVKNKEALMEGGVKGSSEKVNATAFVKEGYAYLQTSFYDKIIKLEEMADIDFDELKEIFDEIDKTEVDPKLYDSILESFKNSLSDSLDKDAMEKESDTIKINGKKYKVTKNSYKLGEKQLRKLVKGMLSNLLKDKDFVKNLAKATGEDEENIKKALEEAKDEAEKMTVSSTVTINLYSKGFIKTEIVGFDYKVDKETTMTCYAIDGNVEVDLAGQIKFTVEKGKKDSKAELSYMDKTIFEATVREFDNEKVDLDFEVKLDAISPGAKPIKGTVYYTSKETKSSISGDYKFKVEYDGEYVQVSGTYSLESKDKLDGLNVKDAIEEKDVDMEKFSKDLETVISKDETLSGMLDMFKNYFNSLNGNNTCPECDRYDTEDAWGNDNDYSTDYDDYEF